MIAKDSDGVIRELAGGYEIVFVRRLARPVDKVWAALTQPERIADWLGVVTPGRDGLLGVGAQFELHFPQSGYRTTCEVVAMDAPRLFAWTWGLPEGPARLETRPLRTRAGRRRLRSHAHQWRPGATGSRERRRRLAHPSRGAGGRADGVRNPWSLEREKPHLDRYAAAVEGLGA